MDTDCQENSQNESRSKESAEVGKAMDSLADRGVEKSMDTNKARAAMKKLLEAREQDAQISRKRAEELAKVKINKSDVNLMASEFNVSTKDAEMQLRESGGDLRSALKLMLQQGLPTASS